MKITMEYYLQIFLSLNPKNIKRSAKDLKLTFILQSGQFLFILFCNRVSRASDTLLRYGITTSNSFSVNRNEDEHAQTFYSK